MNILFLTDNFPPEVNAIATRVFERARYWVQAGHKVTVVTSVPNFPQGRVYPGYKNKWHQQEEIDGIQVIRVKTFIYPNRGFMLRVLDFLSYMFMGTIVGSLQKNIDIVIATSPQFFAGYAGLFVSKLKLKPFLLEISDLWPASIKAVGSLNEGKLYTCLEKMELFMYQQAKHIVVSTPAFKTDMVERGVVASKVTSILNGVELSAYSQRPKDQSLLQELNLNNKFIIGYIGTQGGAHGLENVIETAALLRDNNAIRFLFVGYGAEHDNLVSKVAKLGLDNVIFVPSKPKSEIATYWSLCDVALVHLKNDQVFSTVVPSKLFEAMAMALPILLVSPKGEASEIVSNCCNGIHIEPGNVDKFGQVILELLNNTELMKQFATQSQLNVQKYSREKQANSMLEILDKCLAL